MTGETVWVVIANDKYSDTVLGVFTDRGVAHRYAIDHESEGEMGTSVVGKVVNKPKESVE